MGDLVLVAAADDGVATVTLNRPEKKNALSIALRDEVSDAFDALAVDESVRVVVLTGAGSAFSAGFDLSEFADPDPEHQRRLMGLERSVPSHRVAVPVACRGGCQWRRTGGWIRPCRAG